MTDGRNPGRYEIHRLFARGGMAELFLAEQHGASGESKLVLVKRLLPHLAEEQQYLRMFLDEARLASRLDHPNVVAVLDVGEIDGHYFIAMEYLAGETVWSTLKQLELTGGTMPVRLALQIGIAACDGLHYAHEYAEDGRPMNVVHRDITPSNLMLTYQGQVKLLDFGIARAVGRLQERTGTGVMKGKLAYVAPEQYRGATIDRRADVWSLGAVLHEMLTGQRLFRRETEQATLKAVLEDPIPTASSARDDLPPAVDVVLGLALQRDPQQRFDTALDLRCALETLLSGPPLRLDDYLVRLYGADHARRRIHIRDEIGEPTTAPRAVGGTDPTEQIQFTRTGDQLAVTAPSRRTPTTALTGVKPRRSRWPIVSVVALVTLALWAWFMLSDYLALNVFSRGDDDTADEAMVYAQRGDFLEARQLLDAHLARHPDDTGARIDWLLVCWWTSAPNIADAVARTREAPLDDAQRVMVETLELVNRGRNGEAIAFVEPQVKRFPDRPELQYMLGEARWHGGDLDGGVDALTRAFEIDGHWTMALHHVIDYRLDTRDGDAIERLLDPIATVDPTLATLVQARLAMGRADAPAAVTALRAALVEHPDEPALWVQLAQALALTGDYDGGRDAASHAFELWPADDREYGGAYHMAEYHLYLGQFDQFVLLATAGWTLRALAEALWRGRGGYIENRPSVVGMRSPPLHVASYLEGRHAEGQGDKSLWEDYPEREIHWLGAGLDAERSGDLDEAIEAYRRGLDTPQSGEVRMLLSYHLARALVASDRLDEAAVACEEVFAPRNYRPYRAVVLPDCELWTAAAIPDRAEELARGLDGRWDGTYEHPAVVAARQTLDGAVAGASE